MTYIKAVLIALDQLANAVLGGSPDETLSAHAYRAGWKRREAMINALFMDSHHCRDSYVAEQNRAQMPEEYRK